MNWYHNDGEDWWISVSYRPLDKPKAKYKTIKVSFGIDNLQDVRPPFELRELYASDARNKNRLARSGQKLYLVKNYGRTAISSSGRKRKVNFSIVTSPKGVKPNKRDIEWGYIANGRVYADAKKAGLVDTHFTVIQSAEHSTETKTFQVKAGRPYESSTTKKVDVVYVSGKPVVTEGGTGALNPLIKKTYQNLTKTLDFVQKIRKKLKANKNIINIEMQPLKVELKRLNEEHESSRLYTINRETKFTGGIEATSPKVTFTHPLLKVLSRAGIFELQFFILLKVGAKLQGGKEEKRLIETNEIILKEYSMGIDLSGCIEAGLESELLVLKEKINFKAKASGEACIAGELKYNFTKEKFTGRAYLPAVIMAVEVVAETKGVLEFELVNFKKGIEVTKELDIPNPF